MTKDDDPRRLTDWELDQLRFSAQMDDHVRVASKDLHCLLDEVVASRKAQRHPTAPLLALLPVAGVVAWLFTGEWRWAVVGVLALVAAGAVGAAVDGKRGAR